MIKNEKQFRITRAAAAKFEEAIGRMEAGERVNSRVAPELRQASIEGMKSLLDELREEMEFYEALRAGQQRHFEAHSLEELPQLLIQARIAAGLTQKQLAARLGIKEQQIQRYEARDYAAASLDRLLQVAAAIGIKCEQISLQLAA